MIKILLFITSIVLFVAAFPFAVIYLLFDTLSNLLHKVAVSVDMTGNILLAEPFNDILIIKRGYKFGKYGETISAVLGKNQIKETLTPTGKLLVKILDKIEKNHCIKAISK